MAIATSIDSKGSGLVIVHNFSDQAGSATPFTRNILTPSWAKNALVYLNWTEEGGTTGLVDLTINAVDPVNHETVTPLASWNGITQLSAIDLITVAIGPGITGIADDDAGTEYHLNTPLPRLMQTVLTLSIADADEFYDLTLSIEFSK